MKKESGNERNADRSVAPTDLKLGAWHKTELIGEQEFAAFCASWCGLI